MKLDFFTRCVLPVHDLLCTLGELDKAARSFALRPKFSPAGLAIFKDLAIAAVAFTVQLAIEVGHDPAQMRVLERELIAELTGEPEKTP